MICVPWWLAAIVFGSAFGWWVIVAGHLALHPPWERRDHPP